MISVLAHTIGLVGRIYEHLHRFNRIIILADEGKFLTIAYLDDNDEYTGKGILFTKKFILNNYCPVN